MSVAGARAATRHASGRQAQSAAAGAAARTRLRALAATAAALLGRLVTAVAEPEEPDEPDDQETNVEYAEPDHEDPRLRAHGPMVLRQTGPEKCVFASGPGRPKGELGGPPDPSSGGCPGCR